MYVYIYIYYQLCNHKIPSVYFCTYYYDGIINSSTGRSWAPWATQDDDAPSARFRARFRRGARMDILRSEAWDGDGDGKHIGDPGVARLGHKPGVVPPGELTFCHGKIHHF